MYMDITYAHPNKKPLLLDAEVPDGKGPFPAAIIVHGGSWITGTKTTYIHPLKPLLIGSGYAWFSIDYRLAPQYKYPAAVEDVQAAVHWVRAHAKKYRVDPERIFLIGESAGGYLAAMVAVRNKPESRIEAVVDFYGPHDMTLAPKFSPKPQTGLPEFFGITDFSDIALKTLHDVSPVFYVSKDMPPFLFIHGTADRVVPFESSPLMCDAMKKAGAACEVVKVEGADHGMENWKGMNEWKSAMIDWLNVTLKVKAPLPAPSL
jgi:acetyl esterase